MIIFLLYQPQLAGEGGMPSKRCRNFTLSPGFLSLPDGGFCLPFLAMSTGKATAFPVA